MVAVVRALGHCDVFRFRTGPVSLAPLLSTATNDRQTTNGMAFPWPKKAIRYPRFEMAGAEASRCSAGLVLAVQHRHANGRRQGAANRMVAVVPSPPIMAHVLRGCRKAIRITNAMTTATSRYCGGQVCPPNARRVCPSHRSGPMDRARAKIIDGLDARECSA